MDRNGNVFTFMNEDILPEAGGESSHGSFKRRSFVHFVEETKEHTLKEEILSFECGSCVQSLTVVKY